MNPSDVEFWKWVSGGLGVVGGALLAMLRLRKTAGVDSNELRRLNSEGALAAAENTSRGNWMAEQDERVRELQKSRDECHAENMALNVRVNFLNERLKALEKEAHRMKNILFRLKPEYREILDSDLGPLDESSKL